ncbi:hypothetical protein EJ110_NYTH54836 [Nymphaea thermarum]|nr:hypothetical protein EJ110_NYTH54836 [Nymphaea thermarum]
MARPLPLGATFLVLVIITTNLSSTAHANPGSLLTVYYGHQCFDGPSETYRHCGCHNIEDNYHHHHHSIVSYEYEHFHGRPATLFEDRDCGGSRHPLPWQVSFSLVSKVLPPNATLKSPKFVAAGSFTSAISLQGYAQARQNA